MPELSIKKAVYMLSGKDNKTEVWWFAVEWKRILRSAPRFPELLAFNFR